ncbi:hypothetical protein Q8A67_004649 [Cirrhinus molitorella]|uniref:dCTP pyrophosphatase 1 n=1 Tax=Cirrhinus molitorella TaxID=172907 RepID=A0AA88QD74_9TELE|nr:hypothetical protein Q8A67_004649 [Cirrhinus molitorella]
MALQQNGIASKHNGETSSHHPSTNGNGEIQHEQAERFAFTSEPTLEDIRRMQAEFTDERNWNQFHKPRNLLLALVGEVGEVSELFQWRGEVAEGLPDWTESEREHLAQELSDVLIYLVELAEKCHVDLPQAVLRKMALNRLNGGQSELSASCTIGDALLLLSSSLSDFSCHSGFSSQTVIFPASVFHLMSFRACLCGRPDTIFVTL